MTNNLHDKKITELTDEEVLEYIPGFKEDFDNGTSMDGIWDIIIDLCENEFFKGKTADEITLRDFLIKYNNYINPPKDDFKYLKDLNDRERLHKARDDEEVVRLRVENDRLRAENERLKAAEKLKRKNLMNEIMKEVEERLAYRRYIQTLDNEGAEFVEDDKDKTPLEKHMDEIRSYREWKEANTADNQYELVLERWADFTLNPFANIFEFRGLTNEGRKVAFPLIKQWLNEVIGQLDATKRFKFCFRINGQWHSKTMTPELFRELNDKFNEESLIFSIDKNFDNYVSDPAITELPDWSMFDAISLREVRQQGRQEIGGSFFKYYNRTDIDLSKCQIFDELGYENNEGKFIQRKELDDCCFIYSLIQSNLFTKEEINAIRLRIRNRNLSQVCVRSICEEFDIKAKIRRFIFK